MGLCLSRNPGERIRIQTPNGIVIWIQNISDPERMQKKRGRIRLKITAPLEVKIDREEVYLQRACEAE